MVSSIIATGLLTFSLFSATPSATATPSAILFENPVMKQDYTHVVQSNESLGIIAEKEYGANDYWTTIWNDNDWIKDPAVIESGWKLKIRSQKPVLIEKIKPALADTITPKIQEDPSPDTVPAASSYTQSNYDDVYRKAGEKYGVPWQILYGLHLTETGLRNGHILNHAGSGATGPLQFMPGTWAAYGVDGDGDGVADINNAVDAIYGAANYIQKHGALQNALKYYGGNTQGVLAAAKARGFSEN